MSCNFGSVACNMSLRVVVSSEDGKDLFSGNQAFNFRVKLNRTIQLEGYWVVALTEFTVTEQDYVEKPLFIFSDICQNSFIGNNEQPLLRRVYLDTKMNGRNIIFNNPYYIPVRTGGSMEHIHVYITDEKGEDASFLKHTVTATLHFKKFPFVL